MWIFSSPVEFDGVHRFLKLSKDILLIEEAEDARGLTNRCVGQVLTSEIIAVLPVKTEVSYVEHSKHNAYELKPINCGIVTFTCHVVKRISNHRWRDHHWLFRCADASICQKWQDRIKAVLAGFQRPQSLIVFINPFGGKRKAPKIYETKVAPYFQLAGIRARVIMTERAGHAYDTIVADPDIDKLDGIVCVGGDGMYAEVLNGLLTRTQRRHGVSQDSMNTHLVSPDMRIGIIPAGSTDAVVYGTVGINDAITSALHIVIGDKVAIDVSAVHHNHKLLAYCSSLLAYGYYGDAVVDSERHRWMGPKRYDYSGFKKFVRNISYEGEVRFLPHEDTPGKLDDGTSCHSGCTVCQQAGDKARKLRSEDVSFENGNWQTISGRFLAVNSVTMSCLCHMSPNGLSPFAHIGDGCTDLILVHDTSRFNYMRHLWRTATTKGHPLNMGFVQAFRVKAYSFRPLVAGSLSTLNSTGNNSNMVCQEGPTTSVWNCDGEIIKEPAIDVRVHCQLVKIFGRGIEEEDDSSCTMSCNPRASTKSPPI
ncbi:PREDICTED: ceramide kinase-like [Priapulus caudatus]|uniref:Ceramide kinase-like n=1 Tax=Priapulus caudatus TaxID=37621 RepID=A0ABM1E608_PRICU|nr:PREDICTED: ceramide kinase-like [Priapulus caudatus]